MPGTMVPAPRTFEAAREERRTISGEQRIDLRRSDTMPVAARADDEGRDPAVVAETLDRMFTDGDLESFVDEALCEASPATPAPAADGATPASNDETIPIVEGTMLMPRFQSEEVPDGEAHAGASSDSPSPAIAAPSTSTNGAQSSDAEAMLPPTIRGRWLSGPSGGQWIAAAALFAILSALLAFLGSVVALVVFMT